MNALTPPLPCHGCGANDLETAPAFAAFHRVTSDCKPWPPGGTLARCATCGLVQTLVTPAWQAEADAIYRDYTIYHQSAGAEQNVFDRSSGQASPRSERIIQALRQALALPEHGRLLDIGCGNGAFLAAWSRLVPGWSLCGSEVSDTHRARLEGLPGFERLFTEGLEAIPGPFDVISMIHVLEHVPSPVRYLEQVRARLRPGGWLLLEVPDCARNPTMLLVADHCSHFSPPLLAGVAAAAGFEVLEASGEWVPKEASVLARVPSVPPPAPSAPSPVVVRASSLHAADTPVVRASSLHAVDTPVVRASSLHGADHPVVQASSLHIPPPSPLPSDASKQVFNGWRQLEAILAKVEPLRHRPNFGLFGTAIAATWLDAQTSRTARFFVDEDPNRAGRHHLDRPILAPAQVPPDATVFISLPEPLATRVAARLHAANPTVEVVLP
ncbi:MAG: class I SAM-dependent methyltransferase [Verrucomicrobiales bacterium]|nr:class I SAM-dependent methyltransferase [Verrucomicrobiales bacterium]